MSTATDSSYYDDKDFAEKPRKVKKKTKHKIKVKKVKEPETSSDESSLNSPVPKCKKKKKKHHPAAASGGTKGSSSGSGQKTKMVNVDFSQLLELVK